MMRLAAIALAFVALPTLAHGASALDALASAAFLAVYVLLPGCLLAGACGPRGADALERLSLGAVLGLAAQALAYFVAKAAGIDGLFAAYPLLFLPLAVRAWRARATTSTAAATGRARLGRAPAIALVALLAVCVLRTPYLAPEHWWSRQDADLLFHLGNAAELAHHWPMHDPRVSDLPLVYHVLAYALPAAAQSVLGLPIAEVAALHQAGVGPLVLVLAAFVAARSISGEAWAGVLAAGIVALHADLASLGSAARDVLGADARWLQFHNSFDVGVYHSATTRAGLAALAALVPLARAWLEPGAPRARLAVAVALLAAYASGAKGSVLPPLVAGLAFAIAVEGWRTRTVPRAAIALLVVVCIAGAPYTLWLAGAESSYAGAMFRIAPMWSMRTTGPFVALANGMGLDAAHAPWWLVALCAPGWWVLHALAALAGALVALGRRAPRLDFVALWLFGIALAGMTVASIVAAGGSSELFFAYDGYLALAILAGVAVVRAARDGRRTAVIAFAACAAPVALAGAARTFASVRSAASVPPASTLARDYRAGLDWIRDESPPDAVFVTAGPWTNVSAFGERRAFAENERFTPAWHAARWTRSNGRWVRTPPPTDRERSPRVAAREALRLAPDATSIAAVRAWVPDAPLYVVVDRLAPIAGQGLSVEVGPVPDLAAWRANPALEEAFANASIALYRVR